MKRHYTKKEFNSLALSVVVLEVAGFIAFVSGALVLPLGILRTELAWQNLFLPAVFLMFGGFVLYALGEFVSLLMKIELNTRKPESEMDKLIKEAKREVKKVANKITGNKKK